MNWFQFKFSLSAKIQKFKRTGFLGESDFAVSSVNWISTSSKHFTFIQT